jgi:lysozyme family protein
MKDNFDNFMVDLLKVEGGFVNDPDDSGGATNRGITYRTYETYYKNEHGVVSDEENHLNMSEEEASAIYKHYYWDKVHADLLPSGVDVLVADMAVNSGVSAASKCLQRAVNAEQDGFIGPKTLAKVEAVGSRVLIHKLFLLRREAYFNIAAIRNNLKFYIGWINRLNHMYSIAHTLVYRN